MEKAQLSAAALKDPEWAHGIENLFDHMRQWQELYAHSPTGPGAMASFQNYLAD
jgi:hypothetical protein